MFSDELIERFNERWMPEPNSGCWLWTAGALSSGYGEITENRKTHLAHRLSWELHSGKRIPPKGVVCHKCDNPWCVNPDHLFLGDHRANAADMVAKGRGKNKRHLGEKNGNSRLTLAIAEKIRAAPGSQRKRAREFGVSQYAVWCVLRGITWRGVG